MIYILVITLFLIKLQLRRTYPLALNYDTICHLDYAARIRDNNNRFLDTARLNRPYPFMYPFAYHYLLSLLPKHWRFRVEMGSSAFFDALATLIVYFMTAWMLTSYPALFPENAPIIAALLFAFCPGLLRIGSGPRSFSGTPRVMGELIYLVHLALFQVALGTGSFLAGAGSLFAGALLVITSKFGNQALVFISISIAIFCTPLYFLFVAGSIILSVLLFRKHPLLVLRGQTWHSIWYFKFYRHVFTGFGPRKLQDYILSWREHGLPKLRERRIKNFLFWCLDEQYPLHLALICFTPLLASFFAPTELLQNREGGLLFGALIGGFACFVITKTETCMFLGEGERYLEHILYPITITTIMALNNHPAVLWTLVIYIVTMGTISLFRVSALLSTIQERVTTTKAGVDALNKEPLGLVLPFGYTGYHSLLWGNKPVIGLRMEKELEVMPEEDFRALKAHLPLPTEDFSEVRRRFQPDYIFSERWAFNRYLEIVEGQDTFMDQLQLIYENKGVVLYRVLPENTASAAD
ncbi:MAG: hypothetical protein OCC46_13045 [Pseudodesulfovibrio sp.]